MVSRSLYEARLESGEQRRAGHEGVERRQNCAR